MSHIKQQPVDPHDVLMTGENSFIRLSDNNGESIVDRVSHWRVLWCPAGQGHALFVDSPLIGGSPRLFSDNAGVARFLQRTIETHLHYPFADTALPVVPARFERCGDPMDTIQERIVSPSHHILMSFRNLMSPFVLTLPPGTMNRPIGVYSTFLPARDARLTVNGHDAGRKLFLMNRFGKPESSCCLAWSETWVGARPSS